MRLFGPPLRLLWMDTCLWPVSTPGGSSSPVPTLVTVRWSLRDCPVCASRPGGPGVGRVLGTTDSPVTGGASLQGPTENCRQ